MMLAETGSRDAGAPARMPRVLRDVAQRLLLIFCAAIGIALSARAPYLGRLGTRLNVPLLMVFLSCLFARVSVGRLAEAARDLRYLGSAAAINFIIAPLAAFLLGWFFLRDWPELRLGLLLAMLTPCTDWYLVFTDLAGGDMASNLALLPWNLVLQIGLLPVYLFVFAARLVPLEWHAVIRALGLYVAIPLAAAQLLRWRMPRAAASAILSAGGFLALALVVLAMFTSQGAAVFQRPSLLPRVIPPVLVFYLYSILLAWGISRWQDFPHGRFVSLACTTIARNSPFLLPLAIVLFPTHPAVAAIPLIEAAVEIPSLSLFAAVVRRGVRPSGV